MVEVLIALGVLSIGIITTMIMQSTVVRGNASANTVTSAATLASDRIEQILALDYDDDLLKDTNNDGLTGLNYTDETASTTADQTDTSDSDYTLFWNVAEDEPISFTKTIRILVRRTTGGVERTVVFNYFKSHEVAN